MSPESLSGLRINEIKYLGNTRISAVEVETTESASDVALHETAHVFVAIEENAGIREASVIPNAQQGSLGHVITETPNAAVAMAADALGHSGTGHDRRVASILGNPEAAAAIARGHLMGRHKEMNEFALRLDAERYMKGSRVYAIFKEVTTTKKVKVLIEHADGRRQTAYTKAKDNIIDLSKHWRRPNQNPFETVNRWYQPAQAKTA